jgi:hypothetical protein
VEPIGYIFSASRIDQQRHNAKPMEKASVVPIPKSRPPKSIQDDFRPISLTPTLSKLLESLVGRWILTKIADKLDFTQFGALRGRSRTHALTAITHMCYQALNNRNSVRTLLVDYSKAFDHVDHSTVLRKMAALDIHPRLLKWMHSLLSNHQQRFKLGLSSQTELPLKEERRKELGSVPTSY